MSIDITPSVKTLQAVVIGGGPAGLMAAEVLADGGAQVSVFDAMPTVGRKFLLAGIGGMNITHAEEKPLFLSRYDKRQHEIGQWLQKFDADSVRAFVHDLGIETFVGSSQRVFPKEMKAAPLLRAWLRRMREKGVHFYQRHRFLGWNEQKLLRFQQPEGGLLVKADVVVLAMGGASWPKLGSDGAWQSWLQESGVRVAPLQPSNCGFDAEWSTFIREHFAGAPLKSVIARYTDNEGNIHSREGECVVTEHGLEGSLIYALSSGLRDVITEDDSVTLYLDLFPHHTPISLNEKLNKSRGKNSLSSHWRKTIGLEGVKAALVREQLSNEQLNSAEAVATTLKSLPLVLQRPRPLAEVISSAGGIMFESLTEGLMISALPGVFCAGEMIDWEAPTGGYLLTACFASGHQAGSGALQWLRSL